MEEQKNNFIKRFLSIRGMKTSLVAFVGWLVIFVIFGLIDPVVFSQGNILNVLRSMSKYLIIGIGQSFLLISANIDLSIGSVVAVSVMTTATMMTKGVSPIAACLVALVLCLVIGLINGILVGFFKIPPFIATLGTMFVGRGVAYMVNNNYNTDAIKSGIGAEASDAFQNFFYYGKTLGIYNAFWIAMVLFVIFFFVLQKTRYGRYLYAVGSNPNAAQLSGISVCKITVVAYLISAFCAFVCGLVLCGQSGMGSMESGNTYEMCSVAASVIGGISPLGGTGMLLGTIAGAGVWQTLENGLSLLGVQIGMQRIVVGVIVVAALFADILLRRRKK